MYLKKKPNNLETEAPRAKNQETEHISCILHLQVLCSGLTSFCVLVLDAFWQFAPDLLARAKRSLFSWCQLSICAGKNWSGGDPDCLSKAHFFLGAATIILSLSVFG